MSYRSVRPILLCRPAQYCKLEDICAARVYAPGLNSGSPIRLSNISSLLLLLLDCVLSLPGCSCRLSQTDGGTA